MPSAFEELQQRMHALDRAQPRGTKGRFRPGAWRQRVQTDEQARASVVWCRRMVYELEHAGDSDLAMGLRLLWKMRLDALEKRLGDDDDLPF